MCSTLSLVQQHLSHLVQANWMGNLGFFFATLTQTSEPQVTHPGLIIHSPWLLHSVPNESVAADGRGRRRKVHNTVYCTVRHCVWLNWEGVATAARKTSFRQFGKHAGGWVWCAVGTLGRTPVGSEQVPTAPVSVLHITEQRGSLQAPSEQQWRKMGGGACLFLLVLYRAGASTYTALCSVQ